MTVETHLHRARRRVESERESVTGKREGLAAFAEQVSDAQTTNPRGPRQTVVGPFVSGAVGPGTDRREALLEAFGEMVAPRAGGDGNPLAAVQAELGDEVALALAPTTQRSLTSTLQSQILSAVETRREELAATVSALEAETGRLDAAVATVDPVTEWIVAADETPLSELGFDRLRERRERIEEWRTALGELAVDRQQFLDATTSAAGRVGVDHGSLVRSVYADFEVDYPVLATVARLLGLLDECRRAVESHLVRRV